MEINICNIKILINLKKIRLIFFDQLADIRISKSDQIAMDADIGSEGFTSPCFVQKILTLG
jgi:hypothetical protein